MLVTTTFTVEGRRIATYHGVVSGEAVLGANLFRDLFASIRDVVGGRAGGYENQLQKARQIAIDDMVDEARKLGANAIVGVDLDYQALGETNGMLMVTATGTAVTLG